MKNKVVIVTGGARGIGKAVSKMLAEEEGTKVLAVAKHEKSLESLKEEASGIFGYTCDVTDSEQVKNLIHRVMEDFGRVDVLVNNAGIGVWETVEEMSEENWDLQLNTNLKGVFLLSKHVFPVMKEQGGGHILNVASDLAYTSREKTGAYCASKWGLLGLSGSLLKEGAPYNIKVSTVSPGLVQTDFGGVPAERKEEKGLKPETAAAHIVQALRTGEETGSVDIIVKPAQK
ncbi:SDR family oxidoreductase [Alteribacter natronophilus]|uniref:SDR family oxidoreductase n=1 Tax=Alteribacter natronophilus TaxID=2583810 RepID=UPI00110DF8D6|nr:SDR family oxidoreductase [Alteribacter natronophilus]TMW73430.1 SDR family oxidoreductase [Alteribacter natronophilus]